MRFPSLPPIDIFSFWAGFFSACLIFGLLFYFRKQLGQVRQMLAETLTRLREQLTSGTERVFREETLRRAQTAHMGGSLFALNEILITPRLLVAERPIDPTAPPDDEDVTAIIPILPDFPDLAGAFRAKSASVEDIFAGQQNLLVLGVPGSGKSTLLAHLATRAAQDDTRLFPEGVTPLYVHAADLDLPRGDKEDAAQPLVAAAQRRAAPTTAVRLPRHLRLRLKQFKCVLILDGLDEMPPSQVAQVAAWLAEFKKEYPQHRLIVAAGLWGYGPLVRLGLAPVQMAPWSAADLQALIRKWCLTWDQVIRGRRRKASGTEVDVHILMGWLANNNHGRSPLEISLKAWAALAGDTRGSRPVDWLEALLIRHGVRDKKRLALARISAAALAQEDALGLPRAEAARLCDEIFTGADGKAELDSDDFLDDLTKRQLFFERSRGRICPAHPFLGAYGAAVALQAAPDSATPSGSPGWVRALYFFACMGDLTPLVGRSLMQAADVMQSELLACALWLRDAPPNARWRPEVFKRLARLMLDPNQPENLRLRALAGFIAAGDVAVAALFKQALASPDPFGRRLAVLGLGALGDTSAVPQLKARFADDFLDVRWAAALALGTLGSEAAMDALAEGLLQGDDYLRRACAQALARNAEIGHELLKEAVAHQDIAARRAAMYGLLDVGTDWAIKLLEAVQANEQQWIVRSAAVDALEKLKEPSHLQPQPYQPPESQGWLISWAASKGTGVPPGRGAIEVLRRALTEGEEPVRLAAAEALARLGEMEGSQALYPLLKDRAPLVRDAAFRALTKLAQMTGQKMAAAV